MTDLGRDFALASQLGISLTELYRRRKEATNWLVTPAARAFAKALGEFYVRRGRRAKFYRRPRP